VFFWHSPGKCEPSSGSASAWWRQVLSERTKVMIMTAVTRISCVQHSRPSLQATLLTRHVCTLLRHRVYLVTAPVWSSIQFVSTQAKQDEDMSDFFLTHQLQEHSYISHGALSACISRYPSALVSGRGSHTCAANGRSDACVNFNAEGPQITDYSVHISLLPRGCVRQRLQTMLRCEGET
jgi:hypothetical protein